MPMRSILQMRIVPIGMMIAAIGVSGHLPLSTLHIFVPDPDVLDEVQGHDNAHDFNDCTPATDCNDNDKFQHWPFQNVLNTSLKMKEKKNGCW